MSREHALAERWRVDNPGLGVIQPSGDEPVFELDFIGGIRLSLSETDRGGEVIIKVLDSPVGSGEITFSDLAVGERLTCVRSDVGSRYAALNLEKSVAGDVGVAL